MDRALLRASSRGAVVVAGTALLLSLTAVPASAAQDLCVSIDGTVRVQEGTAKCSSVAGSGNVAIARGANSTAFASGDNSFANANGGDHNVATASGDNNTAIARSPNCTELATGGGVTQTC